LLAGLDSSVPSPCEVAMKGNVSVPLLRRLIDAGHIFLILLVGAGRFERPTPCAQGRCATRLRYAPTMYLSDSKILPRAMQRTNWGRALLVVTI
jgi:hypothetical protein